METLLDKNKDTKFTFARRLRTADVGRGGSLTTCTWDVHNRPVGHHRTGDNGVVGLSVAARRGSYLPTWTALRADSVRMFVHPINLSVYSSLQGPEIAMHVARIAGFLENDFYFFLISRPLPLHLASCSSARHRDRVPLVPLPSLRAPLVSTQLLSCCSGSVVFRFCSVVGLSAFTLSRQANS
ncbi:hypothetical protein PIB30_080071, partial [Stylosanthes scabra]|nr:hypothetical protein [Stylosanthes scabra]